MATRKPLDGIKDKIPALARKPKEAIEAKRDRSWEHRRRNDPETRQVTFRGIPRDAYDRMKAIAAEHGTTVSEVARLFLESSLEDYETGTLEILSGGQEK